MVFRRRRGEFLVLSTLPVTHLPAVSRVWVAFDQPVRKEQTAADQFLVSFTL